VAGLQLVELVDDDEARVQAVFGPFAEGLELRRRVDAVQVARLDLDVRLQSARGHQLLGVAEHQFLGLAALRGEAIPLRASLAVEERDVDRDDRGLERLAVLAGNLVVGGAEAAESRVDVDPAENRSEPELLPGLQHDRLHGPLALVMFQLGGEPKEAVGFRGVEAVGKVGGAFVGAVPEVSGTGELVILPRRYTALNHVARVGVDDVSAAGDRRGPGLQWAFPSPSNSANGSVSAGAAATFTRDRAAGVMPNSTRYWRTAMCPCRSWVTYFVSRWRSFTIWAIASTKASPRNLTVAAISLVT